MKRSKLFLLSVMAVTLLVGCKIPKEFLDSITATPDPAEYKGGKVVVVFEGNFPEKYFTKKMTMTVTPVLTTAEGKRFEAEPITYQGEKVEGNDKTIKYKVGGKYTQTAVWEYVPEMENSVITLEAVVKTKKKEKPLDPVEICKGVNTTALLVAGDPTSGNFKALVTQDNFQREIEAKTDAQIKYLINSSSLRNSELKNEDIVALTKAIKSATDAENVEINGLEISSYASPDGTMEVNEKLADRRGKSTEKYINKELKKLKASISVDSKFTAEDWDGFKSLVESSSIQDKELILRVLSMYNDPEEREKEIKNLSVAFKTIANDILPELRRSKLSLKTTIIGKSDEELLRLALENPAELNIEEILYAATLTKDANEKIKIYKKSTELYPNEYRTFNNLGMAYYENNQVNEAERAFAKALELNEENHYVNFNNGLVAFAKGDYEKAELYFAKAGGVGKDLDYANAAIEILKGNYKKAAELYGSATTNNAALAQMLNNNNSAARQALNNNEAKSATTYYLSAILAARTNDLNDLVENLKVAIEKDSYYLERAKTDVEFIKYAQTEEFQNVVK